MANAKKSIVIIEDDADQAMMYEAALSMSGFHVFVAKNAREGLALTALKKPSLVLLDMVLPDLSGKEVLSELKRRPETKDFKVVVLSNLNKKEVIDECLSLGALDFVVKMQFLPREIVQKVKEYLEK